MLRVETTGHKCLSENNICIQKTGPQCGSGFFAWLHIKTTKRSIKKYTLNEPHVGF